MDELKKCPFCGGDAEIRELNGELKYYVCCANVDNCYVNPSTFYYARPEEAVKAWNRRAGDG